MIWVIVTFLWLIIMGLILHDAMKYEGQTTGGAKHDQGAPAGDSIPPEHQKYAEQKEHRAKESRHWAHERSHNRIVAFFSFVAAGAAVIAALVAYKAYIETRLQVTEARRQADEARRQADIAKETQIRQLRAYVEATGFEIPCQECFAKPIAEWKDSKEPITRNVVAPTFTNGGQTPAFDVIPTLTVYPIPVNRRLPENWICPDVGWPAETGPKAQIVGKIHLMPGKADKFTIAVDPTDAPKFAEAVKATVRLYFCGYVYYTDIFQERHHAPYCFWWIPGHGMYQCENNKAATEQ